MASPAQSADVLIRCACDVEQGLLWRITALRCLSTNTEHATLTVRLQHVESRQVLLDRNVLNAMVKRGWAAQASTDLPGCRGKLFV